MFRYTASSIPDLYSRKTLVIGCGRTNEDIEEPPHVSVRRFHNMLHPLRTAITVDIDPSMAPDLEGSISSETLPFFDNSFECILMECIDSDVFTKDKYRSSVLTIKECARLLKKNGILKISTGKYFYDQDEDRQYEWDYNWLIYNLLPRCGFVRTRVSKDSISGFSYINTAMIEHYKNRVDLEDSGASRPGLGLTPFMYENFKTSDFETINTGISFITYKL